jgi:hypothetical protein
MLSSLDQHRRSELLLIRYLLRLNPRLLDIYSFCGAALKASAIAAQLVAAAIFQLRLKQKLYPSLVSGLRHF